MSTGDLQVLTYEQTVATRAFAADVRAGLGAARKRLDCKYLYDERGAAIFEQICELPEYYPTRTELQIMRHHVTEMARVIGPGATLIELGSGAAVKTRMLLDALPEVVGYVPVDIAGDQLAEVAGAIAQDYPQVSVEPLCADFTQRFHMPPRVPASRRLVYFPGSTIGNFEPAAAVALLGRLREVVQPDGGLLIGVDLRKDPAVLHAAYNDAQGLTARFNRNLLHRINRELGGTFEPESFAHYAFYSPRQGRIEMHLVSRKRQVISAAGRRFAFRLGETIHTENSYKHDAADFTRLASAAGCRLQQTWTDDRQWFAVQLYAAAQRDPVLP